MTIDDDCRKVKEVKKIEGKIEDFFIWAAQSSHWQICLHKWARSNEEYVRKLEKRVAALEHREPDRGRAEDPVPPPPKSWPPKR